MTFHPCCQSKCEIACWGQLEPISRDGLYCTFQGHIILCNIRDGWWVVVFLHPHFSAASTDVLSRKYCEKKLDIWLVVPYRHPLFSAASTDVVSRKYYEISDIWPDVSSLQSSAPSLLPPPPLLRVRWRTGWLSLLQRRCRSTLRRHSAWQANGVSQHGNGQLALGRARLEVRFRHPSSLPATQLNQPLSAQIIECCTQCEAQLAAGMQAFHKRPKESKPTYGKLRWQRGSLPSTCR